LGANIIINLKKGILPIKISLGFLDSKHNWEILILTYQRLLGIVANNVCKVFHAANVTKK
ncbi:MAG: hypothetical protein OEQ53_20295, partial [Saprospiraceae bacterium]|nr:hypothetical protein [Saprospiraceae bacterium]